jgi:hypothetical protein
MADDVFANLIRRFEDEMGHIDDVTLVVIKGHLLLEELLTEILGQHVIYPKYLQEARLGFHQKAVLARAYCLRKDQAGEWDLIFALNALRNLLAHKLNAADRQTRIDRVKEIYAREAKDAFKELKKSGAKDAQVLTNAIAHCGGYLHSFEQDARAFRELVWSIDRQLNPNLPGFEAKPT